jgi:hypothetical protein
MEKIVEEFYVDDGVLRPRLVGEPPFRLVYEKGQKIRFELCRKEVALGNLEFEQWWMDKHSVYGDRNRNASNLLPIIDFYVGLCNRHLTILDQHTQDCIILAHLVPHIRSNGARRVVSDAVLTRAKTMGADRRSTVDELEQLLRSGRYDEVDIVRFHEQTMGAIGPPDFEDEIWELYQEMADRLLAAGRFAFFEKSGGGVNLAIDQWKEWMTSIGRRRGFEVEKKVLDILSYESRAAIHRCCSQVWDHLVFHLADKYGMSHEAVMFHRFWHLEQQQKSNMPDKGDFRLFHGHVFALHPACSNFLMTPTGRELVGNWLLDPHSSTIYRRMLQGIAIAVFDYSSRVGLCADERKQRIDSVGGSRELDDIAERWLARHRGHLQPDRFGDDIDLE